MWPALSHFPRPQKWPGEIMTMICFSVMANQKYLQFECLFNSLFTLAAKKVSKLRVIGSLSGNSLVTSMVSCQKGPNRHVYARQIAYTHAERPEVNNLVLPKYRLFEWLRGHRTLWELSNFFTSDCFMWYRWLKVFLSILLAVFAFLHVGTLVDGGIAVSHVHMWQTFSTSSNAAYRH